MRLRRFASFLSIIIVLASLAVLLPAAPVMAANGVFTLSATTGPVGTVVTFPTSSGFTVGSTYTIAIAGGAVGTTGVIIAGGALPGTATFTVPALPAGPRSVTVTTNAPDTCTAVNFTVNPSISPSQNTGQVGSSISLTGNGFSYPATVMTAWDTTSTISSAVSTDVNGSFVIYIAVPQSVAGGHRFTSTDSNFNSATFYPFTVTPSVALNSASVTVGSQMTITGSGFASISNISIYVNSAPVASTVTNSTGSFTYNLPVPTTPHGTYALFVSDTSGNTTTSSFTVTPNVTISPAQFTGGSTINISGTGFAASSTVSALVDGNVVNASAASTDSAGSFSITGFAVPKMPGGSHTFQVADASGNAVTVNFNITQAITIAPTSGTSGTNVQVIGSGFSANTTVAVSFDSANVNPSSIPQTDSTGAFSASFAVPRASGGNHQVVASDGTFSAAAVFNVTSSAKIDPVTGPVGTTVTVTGSSFGSSGAITITFDSAPVATVTADTAGSFNTTFTVPQSATGTRPVIISDGTRTATFSFAIKPALTVTPTAG